MHGDKKNGANREAKTEQNTVKTKQVKKMQSSPHFVLRKAAQPPFVYEFYEKRPWLKNKRAAGYKYRSKGKVPIQAIDNMVERLTSYTIDNDLKKRSDEARSALYKRKDFSEALCRDVATKKMKELAEKIPPTLTSLFVGSRSM